MHTKLPTELKAHILYFKQKIERQMHNDYHKNVLQELKEAHLDMEMFFIRLRYKNVLRELKVKTLA